jgi:type IV secretory pathway component VirB8
VRNLYDIYLLEVSQQTSEADITCRLDVANAAINVAIMFFAAEFVRLGRGIGPAPASFR